MGDDFDNGLDDPEVPSHMGVKSRWIIQGFHDPDIHLLVRTVPTPATSDVPFACQLLSSLRARAFVADVSQAFTQGVKGLRPDRIFALPPPGGFPGEGNEDILIELLAEVYGLVSGPPGWRFSLLSILKDLGFKNHPLAPCVFLYYEDDKKNQMPMQLSGLLVVETDDLLGGGIGDKFHRAVDQLKRRLKFGKWIVLQEKATEYGGRTLKQHSNFDINISMVRYLKEKGREVVLQRGRCKIPLAPADASEVAAMRGLNGN